MTDKKEVKEEKKEVDKVEKAPEVKEAATNEDNTENKTVDSEAQEEAKEEKTTETPAPKKKAEKDDSKWYVISTQSGHEQRVADAITQRVEASKLQKVIREVLVPIQKKIVVKGGKQSVKEERIFPGYVLLKMILDQQTWEIITNTEGVSGFVRTTKNPLPLQDDEVKAIMKFMEIEQPAFQSTFSVGDAVKIKDGAFVDFVGSVSGIDETKGKIKVLISIFGRETPVELEFNQVTKL